MTSPVLIDLTLEQYEGHATHPGHGRTPVLLRGTASHGSTFRAGISNVYDDSLVSVANEYIIMTGHTGTHLDAPYHVDHLSSLTIDKVPIERTFGPAVWLDLHENGVPAGVITDEDLERAEGRGGEAVRTDDIVLVHTGWLDKMHADERCVPDAPGMTKEAGEWLRGRGAKAVGIDTVSPDQRDSYNLPVHSNLLRPRSLGLRDDDYILIYENLCNIGSIPSRRFIFFGLPIPIRGSTGSPVRAVALSNVDLEF